jgi:hypothetical protein
VKGYPFDEHEVGSRVEVLQLSLERDLALPMDQDVDLRVVAEEVSGLVGNVRTAGNDDAGRVGLLHGPGDAHRPFEVEHVAGETRT